jgi:hypothetical protein
MTGGGWKALAMGANLAMVLVLLASLRAGSAFAPWIAVPGLIVVSAYADFRGDKARRGPFPEERKE